MEETMRSCWTVTELMYLTRNELCGLAAEIEQHLALFEAGSIKRLNALTSLDNIRRTMVMRRLHY
jgi:hypothetical protein